MKRIERLLTGEERAPGWRRSLSAAIAVIALAVSAAAACGGAAVETHAQAPQQPAAAKSRAVARWMPAFDAAGKRYGVDPALLAAMAIVESNGDPEARSPAGSVGLMQIMPSTGKRIAEERGLADYRVERLREPEYNIDFGAYYLSKQLQTFGASVPEERAIELAAAAYNAGPGRVRAHLDDGKPLPDEATRYQSKVLALWKELRAAR